MPAERFPAMRADIFIIARGKWRPASSLNRFQMGSGCREAAKASLNKERPSHTNDHPGSPMHSQISFEGLGIGLSQPEQAPGSPSRHIGIGSPCDALLQVLADRHRGGSMACTSSLFSAGVGSGAVALLQPGVPALAPGTTERSGDEHCQQQSNAHDCADVAEASQRQRYLLHVGGSQVRGAVGDTGHHRPEDDHYDDRNDRHQDSVENITHSLGGTVELHSYLGRFLGGIWSLWVPKTRSVL